MVFVSQELGGNSWWFDRFLGQIVATFYYFMTVFLYIVSPRMACKFLFSSWDPLIIQNCFWSWWIDRPVCYRDADHFSECVESHAFETYDKFLKTNGGCFFFFNIFNISCLWAFIDFKFTQKSSTIFSFRIVHQRSWRNLLHLTSP